MIPAHGRRHGFTTEEQSDALRELGNVAFSHAATALSVLVGRRVEIDLPRVDVVEAPRAENLVAEEGEPLCIVTLRILGERQGVLSLVFPERDAVALAAMLEGVPVEERLRLTPEAQMVLAEVANIMCGSALLAMYRFLKISLIHASPVMHLRNANARERADAQVGWRSDLAIVVETRFTVEGQVAHGAMVISLADMEFFLEALFQHGGL